MKLAGVAIGAAVLATPLQVGAAAPASMIVASCYVDDETTAADRAAPEGVARTLVQDLTNGRPDAVFGVLSDAAKVAAPLDQLASMARAFGLPATRRCPAARFRPHD